MFREKKAQITIFILIALVILIAIMVLIYIQTTIIKKEVVPEVKRAIEIPSELIPVVEYIESNIKLKAEQGLKILGEHGGYIYFENLNPNYVESTEGDALEYLPGTNFLVPYWHYMESDNDCLAGCVFESKMLMLCRSGRECITSGDNSIEEQLDRYINNELKALLNFDSLRKQGYDITELGDVETTTTITDEFINFYVKYPLEIKKEAVIQKIKDFSISIESDLAEMYEMAYDIANYESERCFIGKHVNNYYSVFYGLDEGQLPPEYEMTIGTHRIKIWSLAEVKEILKEKTRNAINIIGIFNQGGFEWPEANPDSPYYYTRQGILDQYVFYPLRRYHDASVSLNYNPWWNPYLDIRPREGEILMPTNFGIEGGGLAALFSTLITTKIYDFSYQYSFPVIVEIRKNNERGEQLFRIALESNIRDNKCFGPEATLRHSASVLQSTLCDESERIIDLTLDVKDDSNSEPLSDVRVSFYAGETCFLGTTNTDGVLVTKYPETFGRGSMIILGKTNYLTRFISVPDLTANFETSLKPKRNKNISLKLIDMTTLRQMSSARSMSDAITIRNMNLKDPDENETIIVQLKRNKDGYQDDEFNTFIYLNEGEFVPETIELLPGKYNISVQLFSNQEITLPEERDRACVEGVVGSCDKVEIYEPCPDKDNCYIIARCDESTVAGAGGCSINEEFVYDEMSLSMLPNGGAVYDNWELIDYNYLDSGDKLTIYLFKQDLPTRHSHLTELNKYEEYSQTHRYAIEPDIS